MRYEVGQGAVVLSDMLEALKITGTVSNVEVSSKEVFLYPDSPVPNQFLITSDSSYFKSSPQWIKVTVGSVTYKIDVVLSNVAQIGDKNY